MGVRRSVRVSGYGGKGKGRPGSHVCTCAPCTGTFFLGFIYLLLERGEEREKGRETSMCRSYVISCLSHAPNWGSGLQPRHVP